jgi:hypothetical protein
MAVIRTKHSKEKVKIEGAGGGGAKGSTSGAEAPLPSEDLEEALPDGEGC